MIDGRIQETFVKRLDHFFDVRGTRSLCMDLSLLSSNHIGWILPSRERTLLPGEYVKAIFGAIELITAS